MKQYHKIKTLFKRDDKTKKLIVGKFADEEFEYLQNNLWEFTEKVDGTNIRIHWDGHQVTFGGRTDKAQIPAHLMNRLIELFAGEVNAQMFEQKFGETEVTLYGEGYGPKIQNGGAYREEVDFILFDVLIGDTWLRRDDVDNIAAYFAIDSVPTLFKGTIQEGVDYVLSHEQSFIGRKGAVLEGLVGRPTIELKNRLGERIIIKIKRKDFE